MLAAKSALGLRIDSLSTWGVSSEDTSNEPTEEEKSEMGRTARLGIERRLRALEGKPLKSLGNANQTPLATQKFDIKEARKYNPDADGLTGDEPASKKSKKAQVNGTTPKKSLVQEVDSEDEDETMADAGADDSESEDEDVSMVTPSKSDKRSAEKAAKKARKAERAAKREAKAAKKAAKEAKKSEKGDKKRKRDDGEEKVEKKKKKKSKD
jgi:nucleolar protein 58